MRVNFIQFFIGILLLLPVSILGQSKGVIHGELKDKSNGNSIEYANVVVLTIEDSVFVEGTISDEYGRFTIEGLKPSSYLIKITSIGYGSYYDRIRVGAISPIVNLGLIYLNPEFALIDELTVTDRRDEVGREMDKKVYGVEENISQLGGSVLQAMQNLPGITVDRDGRLFLRGSDKLIVLIDGKQTAITGFGNQQALDNIPASSIERVEIINNPSSKYDASGMAGIVNIIFKKNKNEGWNGKVGMTMGVGGLGLKSESISEIMDQYRFTPKINPSASVSYKKDKINFIAAGDVLYQKAMVKNEFIDRIYEGTAIRQQFLENRTQPIYNFQTGLDIEMNKRHSFNISGIFNDRAYTDLGDIPYLNAASNERIRLWRYLEDELNRTIVGRIAHQYKFVQPGRSLKTSFSYSYRKKEETFHFENFIGNSVGTDTFFLSAKENVYEFNSDYTHPLRNGRVELGTKQRLRLFPNEVGFIPGLNSIVDPTLAGYAEYQEVLSALYGNYIYEQDKFELEAGVRLEYAKIDYLVDENHSIFNSEGFTYFNFFPNVRFSFKPGSVDNVSVFFSRRVDRPEEKNLRSFPTYADPEILRIGNPALLPQFSNNVELAYKRTWQKGYWYNAVYLRFIENILTSIVSPLPGSLLLSNVDQNASTGKNLGMEMVISQKISKDIKLDLNGNIYRNVIDAFSTINPFNRAEILSFDQRLFWSGNAKLNLEYKIDKDWQSQITAIYLAPDILPQGSIGARYSVDLGLKRKMMNGRGELFFNVSDIFNTFRIVTDFESNGLAYSSTDFYETQVVRLGFQYRL